MEQREIKFRAWDSEVERMVYSEVGDDEYIWHIDMGGIILLNHQINDDGQHFYPKIEVPFMQYTGLKDKNNKDIYDQDLLKDDNGNIGKVIWGDHGWLVEFESETMDLTETEHWAVICGNEFEN